MLKNLLIGSPLEPAARWAYALLTRDKNYRYDRELFQVMARTLKPDSCFVDVGCHKGVILKHALRLSPRGNHWAFEPIPEMCSDLQRRFPMVNIFGIALSDVSGVTEFNHVVSAPALSGLKQRAGVASEQSRSISVETARLDDIIPHSAKVDMIKVDVEGAELLVLRGAGETISRNKPVIVFEHGLGGADSYGHTPEQVFDLLTDCGLKLSTMARLLAAAAPLSRKTFCERFYTGKDFYFIAF